MALAARVTAVDPGTSARDLSRCWAVVVDVDPCREAPDGELLLDLERKSDTPPVAIGDAVVVPIHDGTHLVAHHPAGDVRLKILGWPRQPGEPLNWSGYEDADGRKR